MFRKILLIPALVIGTGLFLTETSAKAQVSIRVGIGAPAYPPPILYRPAPLVIVPYSPPIVSYPAPVYVAHHHHFRVVYRASCNDPWVVYEVVRSSEQAHHAANHLRRLGYEASVWRN